MLLFDDLMRPDYETLGVTAQQSIAVAMARQWIRDELLPADLVAVASFDYKLKVHSDFGRDPAVLDRALKRAMMRRDPDRSEPTAIAPGPSLLRHLPQGKELRDRSRSIPEALWILAEGLRPLEGRKNLVLFSIGAGLSSYLAPVLNRSNVDVYTVDISPPMAEHLQAVALEALARDTDGHFFRWGSYLDSLRRVSRRTAGYYQLWVRVQRRADGTLPERVAVDVVHPRLRVTALGGTQDAPWEAVSEYQIDAWGGTEAQAQVLASTVLAAIYDMRGAVTDGWVTSAVPTLRPVSQPDEDTGRPRYLVQVSLTASPT